MESEGVPCEFFATKVHINFRYNVQLHLEKSPHHCLLQATVAMGNSSVYNCSNISPVCYNQTY